MGGDDKKPLEIEADEAIEWNRAEKQYIARGNAVAVQGDSRIKADLLVADYAENKDGETEIRNLTATGTVRIQNPTYKAFGDKAVHNVQKNTTIITGRALSLEGDNMVVTARDALEYHGNNNVAYARGNARAVQGNDVVRAETLIAHFKENAQGEMVLSRVEGTKNITIVTDAETISGDRGTYNVIDEQAVIIGNVKITRGENQMNGDRATIDMKTGLSRLSMDEKTDTSTTEPRRVRALLFKKGDN